MGYTVYHHNDPDGYFGATIANEILITTYGKNVRGKVKFCEVNYPKVFPLDKMGDDDIVIIVDVSFGKSTFNQLKSICDKAKRVIWIDHHATSKDEVVPILEKEPIENLQYYIDTTFCGALNAFICLSADIIREYIPRYKMEDFAKFKKEFVSIDTIDDAIYDSKVRVYTQNDSKIDILIPSFLVLLDDYDCHKLRFKKSDYFVYAIRNKDLDYYLNFIMGIANKNKFNTEVVKPLIDKGQLIVEWLKEDYNNEIVNSFIADFSEYGGPEKVICINSRGNSWVFSNYFDEYDMCCLFHLDDNTWKYSLYANDDAMARGVNCSVVAGKLGGGGHPGASGFSTDKLFDFKVVSK